MESQHREWLLILDEASADDVFPLLRALVSVAHIFSPRVIVVSSERDPVSTLSPLPGVRRVYAEDVSAEEIELDDAFMALSREEILAARAWLLRRERSEKDRPGEGLTWDAEGFEPP